MRATRIIVLLAVVVVLAAVPAMVLAGINPLSWGQGGGNAGPGASPDGDRVLKPAPIDDLQIVVRESMPPQYVARVQYGLPGGCAEPAGYELTRDGKRLSIAVDISLPADPNVACTMIYGMGTYDVGLGSDFVSGETYTVDVNGTETEFTAQ